jgi:hypothetical protein
MGQPIRNQEADLKAGRGQTNFALNLPTPDVNREAKIKAAEGD